MRYVVFLFLSACGSSQVPIRGDHVVFDDVRETPARATSGVSEHVAQAAAREESAGASAELPTVHARALRADELIEAAGIATLLDNELRVAAIDSEAMERWFVRKPRAVFLYAERPLEVTAETSVRGDCQRIPLADDTVLNQLSFMAWRQGDQRTLVELGQDSVEVVEQRLERGAWETSSVRPLPMGAVAWDDTHIAYAEGAEILEVACVPTLRAELCSEGADPWVGPRGHCVHQALVVRPWRASTVPHVGDVIPFYVDRIPDIPPGSCRVECAPSACDEALRMTHLPRVPLYSAQAPTLAVFRTRAACRASVRSADAP